MDRSVSNDESRRARLDSTAPQPANPLNEEISRVEDNRLHTLLRAAHWDELRARYEDAVGQPSNHESAVDVLTVVGQLLNHRDGLHVRPVHAGLMDDLAYCVSQEHRLISRLEELGRRSSQEARQQEQAVREALEIYRARIAELAVGWLEVRPQP